LLRHEIETWLLQAARHVRIWHFSDMAIGPMMSVIEGEPDLIVTRADGWK
jgi:hypothetical protein